MGNRTVVILYNDQASEWGNDPDLGQKIIYGMNDAMSFRCVDRNSNANLHYGKIVQCAHADTQSLVVLDSYDMRPLVHSFWRRNESVEETNLRLLKEAADRLGYVLQKKQAKSKTE